jgi:hypothetical protein
MFRQLLQNIQGADIPMVSSLIIFFIFFILIGIYLLIIDKNHIKHMSNLPLEGDENKNSIL